MTSGLATASAEPEQPLPRPARRLLRYADGWLLLGCLAVAAGSLAVPALLGFDPWVWLIWGRELLRGGLATDGTVAWKPLPVLVTAVLAPFGAAAPALWTVLARAFGLFGLVLVFRLAARFAGAGPGAGPAGRVAGLVAGAVAAAAFLITPDAEARWLATPAAGQHRAGHRRTGSVGGAPAPGRAPRLGAAAGLRGRADPARGVAVAAALRGVAGMALAAPVVAGAARVGRGAAAVVRRGPAGVRRSAGRGDRGPGAAGHRHPAAAARPGRGGRGGDPAGLVGRRGGRGVGPRTGAGSARCCWPARRWSGWPRWW